MNSTEIRAREIPGDALSLRIAQVEILQEIAAQLAEAQEAREAKLVKIEPVTLEEAAKIVNECRHRFAYSDTFTAGEDVRDAINNVLAERAK